ncbi:hypothetical protein RJ639_036534 [Escallonia herrerae]|uniref:Rho GTPase-activating protein REN1-like n=1 Tax=Escallonia herrerae TaxID=1293975 RepID=A0AA88WSR8_9ASTE|nr:hypothetical protein RJ639_036534 [Escallonia herrerae]
MTNRSADSSQANISDQGEGGGVPPPGPTDQLGARAGGGDKVYKSGPLFLSSKGIGWTSWKKRWFRLTHTSLVFFRNDPNVIPQKGSEVNLTLGGIDLNSSGSVVIKADKKLLTVLFPDGRDGRAFTLKAETLEDLHEWKDALEEALANAPSAALVMGQNGIFKNDQADAADAKDRQPVKSFVIGRPILLALEDIDGTPSFLEKALKFLEEHGVKVEGILRQAADVDDVESRIREYEQGLSNRILLIMLRKPGKSDFFPEEDPHIIADCVKYVLRELPSSPVPASCCNALLEAFRTDRSMRVTAMRAAICETFPEPNRRLLQRVLMMMQAVAAHKAQNRMSTSAVAACMAPLLLRPLLAGDCELENCFDVVGDGSVQLLQAAAAANHAQAIVITLLEDYEKLFGESSMSTELYTDSEESGSHSEELSDDDETFEDNGDDYTTEGSDGDADDDFENASSRTCSEIGDTDDRKLYDAKDSEGLFSSSDQVDDDLEANQRLSSCPSQSSMQHDNVEGSEDIADQISSSPTVQANKSGELLRDDPAESSPRHELNDENRSTGIGKPTDVSNGPARSVRRPAVWGRTPAKKNLSMESIEFPSEDETYWKLDGCHVIRAEIQKLEAKGNEVLQENLEKHKNALHERRLALEQDVKSELQQIAQAEADVINLEQKADDLGVQLNQQREQNSECESIQDPSTVIWNQSAQDTLLNKPQNDIDTKQEPPSLPNKSLPPDSARNFKKSGSRGEATGEGDDKEANGNFGGPYLHESDPKFNVSNSITFACPHLCYNHRKLSPILWLPEYSFHVLD